MSAMLTMYHPERVGEDGKPIESPVVDTAYEAVWKQRGYRLVGDESAQPKSDVTPPPNSKKKADAAGEGSAAQ